jgi:hypothetical protein
MNIVPELPFIYDFTLSFFLSFAVWWLFSILIMFEGILHSLHSGYFDQASFLTKLDILFIRHSAILGLVSTFVHFLLSGLGL